MSASDRILQAARDIIRIAMLEQWLRERARGPRRDA